MKKDDFNFFSENVKRRRKAAGYSSAESFSEHLGISYPTYRDVEGGISEGRFELRQLIAKNLSCTVADLYSNPADVKTADFSSVADFLSRYASAPPHIQKIVLMIVYKDVNYLKDVPERSVQDATKLLKALSAL